MVGVEGHIMSCMLEDFNGFTIYDKLRESLLNDESEHKDLFSQSDQNEFLFHLFRVVCVGGSMCQGEQKFEEYKNAIKVLYKELLTVHKSSQSGRVEITSAVFHIVEAENKEPCLFPHKNKFNWCYVVLTKASNSITVVYKPYQPFW